jgi:hypothetical protein
MKAMILPVFVAFALVSGSLMNLAAQVPASGAPVTTAESPEIRDLQKVEDNWSNALNQRDQYGLELVLSPLFVNVAASGDISTRDQSIVALLNEQDKYAVTDMHVITVRMLGDVAVANGTYSFTHRVNNTPVVERGVFTHVFQKLHGNWVCMNAQRTVLRQDGPAGKPAKAKAKSDAELGFHIPLFSKSDKANQ